MAQVPVVPIYFEGTNSRMFHLLGRIHPYIRTFLLIREYFKKNKSIVNVKTGQIFYPETYNQYETDKEMSDFFRNEVYKLK
jgi:putative hemolysin